MVETSTVNDELQTSFSEFSCHVLSGVKRAPRIRASINFLELALERGRQSTRSSPESLFAKSFQKTDPDQPPFLMKHEGGLAA